MRQGSSCVATLALALTVTAGCFPPGATSSDGGSGSYGFDRPTLLVTINGVHFGPTAPDAGAFADLVVSRDATSGRVSGASFRLSATIGSAGCALAFDRYGDGAALGVGQYTVQSMQGTVTGDGTVYPTAGERFSTPEGGAGCSGQLCDGAAFVLSAVDATHAFGYFMGNVQADSGAGVYSAVCSFWVPMRTYQP